MPNMVSRAAHRHATNGSTTMGEYLKNAAAELDARTTVLMTGGTVIACAAAWTILRAAIEIAVR